jgi:topoisomerase-4 subunit A
MTLNIENNKKPINDFLESAYLDYSMYVILDRALPSIADGLKPVQRRIIYAMNELHLDYKAKHKKSARTVGDVLGKYHPHGDSACYEAMVMMAQPFSYRQPIIDGQGNWGSTDDPKSFAAMRYTEARLQKYADVLLGELDKTVVDYKPNFDGSLNEPVVLPAKLPNILVNGTMGIAVGMATDIPPHNVSEIIKATKYCIDHEDATVVDVMKFIKAPDYPTAGVIITSKKDIQKVYETGRGSIKVRARYTVEGNEIIITELPYQVSGNKVLEQIGAQVEAKKLTMIEDLQDESDRRNPIRLVVKLKRSSKVDPHSFMLHLFSSTDLEKSFRVNMNTIGLNGAPAVKSISEILHEWIVFRRQCVVRRMEARIEKILNRSHLIEGLLIAYLNIDEVIEVIRDPSEESPKECLMTRFDLTEIQSNAILDIKLRSLARIEEMELTTELSELNEERLGLVSTLESKEIMNDILKTEIEEVNSIHGNARLSEILDASNVQEAVQLKEDDLLASDPVSVCLSEKGWLRMGKGHSIDDNQLSYKTGDKAQSILRTRSNKPTILLDQTGRTFTIKTHTLPSARGYGDHVSQYVEPQSGVSFIALLDGLDSSRWLMTSSEGYGFICEGNDMISAAKKGKALLKTENLSALTPHRITDHDYIAVVSENGHLAIFESKDLPMLTKGKGNKLITLAKGDKVTQVIPVRSTEALKISASGKTVCYSPSKWEAFICARNRKGKALPKYMKDISIMVEETKSGSEE